MGTETRIKADLHIHTVASGHGYSTVREICDVARSRGLEMVGICDHGPAMPGAAHPYHFANMIVLPRMLDGIKVLRGAECNIVDIDGNLDLHERILKVLDIVLAGFHLFCGFDDRSVDENTQALTGAIQSGFVDILVHPGNPLYPLNYDKVVYEAARAGVALEVNNASFTIVRRGSEKNCEEVVRLARELGAYICVGSDAHDASMVGVFDSALQLIDRVGFPEERIINRNAETVVDFLKSRGKELRF